MDLNTISLPFLVGKANTKKETLNPKIKHERKIRRTKEKTKKNKKNKKKEGAQGNDAYQELVHRPCR